MDRFQNIKKNLLRIAEEDPDIKAVVLIGSSTRNTLAADEYSDLDVVIVTDNTEKWLYGDYPGQLGKMKISFTEPALGGGKERRILYDESLDVDMIIFTPAQFETAVIDGVASEVMNRGYVIMYDAGAYSELLGRHVSHEIMPRNLLEQEFINMVNDFFFHTVWAAKKILRGELWTAKMCIDAYLKNYLLNIIEMYSASKNHVDVWHDGRFLDRWAEKEIVEDLKKCFAHYNKEDMTAAIFFTAQLFGRLASQTAELKGYFYPKDVEDYAKELLNMYFAWPGTGRKI